MRTDCAYGVTCHSGTDEETIGQVHSIGPWSVNYINPADDPENR